MTMRRIATAEGDLKDAEALKQRLSKPNDNQFAGLIVEKKHLEDALKEAKSDEARASNDLKNSATEQGGSQNKEWKALEEEWKETQRRIVEESNAIKVQEENSQRLRSRIKEIVGQIEHEKESRVVKLRFPREREKTKQSYPIICKFGKIYPVLDRSAKENTKMIKWADKEDARVSLPIESEGWSIETDDAAISGMLGKLSSAEYYVTFLVYPDSFDAYRGLRDRVISAKLDFGLTIESMNTTILFTPDGHTPPPL